MSTFAVVPTLTFIIYGHALGHLSFMATRPRFDLKILCTTVFHYNYLKCEIYGIYVGMPFFIKKIVGMPILKSL